MSGNGNEMIGGMQLNKSDVKTFEFKTEGPKEKKKKKELEQQIMSIDQSAQFMYRDQGAKGDEPVSPEMKKFSMSMRGLASFLAQKTPSIVDTQALDQGCVEASKVYKDAAANLQACISKPESYGNDPAVRKQLEKTLESLRKESAHFRKKVKEYRDMMMPTEEGTVVPTGTWGDVLRYERAIRFETGNTDGTLLKKTGSGSLYYRIERQGKDAQDDIVFRKQEDVPAEKTKELIRQFYRSLPADTKLRRERREFFEALLTDQRDGMIGEKSFDKFYSDLRRETPRNIYRKITATNTEAADLLREFPPEVSLGFCKLVKGLSKTLFMRTLVNSSGIKPGSSLSDRSTAASRMADMLGINDMVQKSQSAGVLNKGKYIKGSVLEEAKGSTGPQLEGYGTKYSKDSVSRIFGLQVFDFICGNCTRQNDGVLMHTNEDDNKISDVKAVNNDVSFGNLRYSEIKNGFGNLRADDEINIKGMPNKMLNKLLRLEENTVRHALCDIVDKKELDALLDRISGLKRRIMGFPSLRQNDKGDFYFENEDPDDGARAVAQLKRRRDELPEGKKLSDVSLFYDPLLGGEFDPAPDANE